MSRFLYIFYLFLFLGNTTCLHGQDFFLNGSATVEDSCYQLTSEVNWDVGSIWNGEKINLNESFEVSVDLFVGCKDNEGADGLVFGLQPVSTSIGVAGGDLGFGNVMPSLGVEFDTYQNENFADPTFDHITIVRDGIVNHNVSQGALAGPVQANATNPNIEDCQYHPLQISWNAGIQTLSVYLDCELRLTYVGDIVTEIFNGDPLVFWGFTSATGGLNNIHEVCFSYTSFIDGLVDQTICPGTDFQLEANGGTSYQWSPPTGLSNPNIANPIASPETTTLYTVEILDDCGVPFYDDILITVENEQFNIEIISPPNNPTEISPGTELNLEVMVTPAGGANYTYLWSSAIGSSFANPDLSNTAITASLNQIGMETITVLVTSEDGCIQEANFNFEIVGALYDIPNVFTPDGDSNNDDFGIITAAEVAQFNCKVFNRWGELVFETNNQSEFWDGTYKDKAAPSDVYVYFINFEIGNILIEKKGDLTLIR